MGYKALITLDLSNATSDQRSIFYQVLEDEKWIKLKNLTTSWKASFDEVLTRDGCIDILISDMSKAKAKSKVNRVDYAIQLSKPDLVHESL